MSADEKPLKPLPEFATDAEAETFVDEADLSEYDLSQMVQIDFGFTRTSEQISMMLPRSLLDAIHTAAMRRGMSSKRFIRETLENALATSDD